jgi:hypothetical protein
MIDIDVAIDYDDTYSANPEIWTEILLLMKIHGFKTICATNRRDTEANRIRLSEAFNGKVLDIVYCNGYKDTVCRKKGYNVLVWIENDPRVAEFPAPLWWCRLVGAYHYCLKTIGLK